MTITSTFTITAGGKTITKHFRATAPTESQARKWIHFDTKEALRVISGRLNNHQLPARVQVTIEGEQTREYLLTPTKEHYEIIQEVPCQKQNQSSSNQGE